MVSVVSGRTTSTSNKLDWICINKLFVLPPPSTFSDLKFVLASFCIAVIISFVRIAIASRVALAICPFWVPLVIPVRVPVACGFQ